MKLISRSHAERMGVNLKMRNGCGFTTPIKPHRYSLGSHRHSREGGNPVGEALGWIPAKNMRE
jgi:hypothetical protein